MQIHQKRYENALLRCKCPISKNRLLAVLHTHICTHAPFLRTPATSKGFSKSHVGNPTFFRVIFVSVYNRLPFEPVHTFNTELKFQQGLVIPGCGCVFPEQFQTCLSEKFNVWQTPYIKFFCCPPFCVFFGYVLYSKSGAFCQEFPSEPLKKSVHLEVNEIHMFLIYSHFLHQNVTFYRDLIINKLYEIFKGLFYPQKRETTFDQ